MANVSRFILAWWLSNAALGAGSGGYAGLDRFGRVKDLHYVAGAATVHRYQYGYDAAGNRLFARVTQAATQDAGGNPVPHDNDRSYLYNYDELNRLYTSALGALDANNAAMLSGSGDPSPLTSAWTLDNLGNWSGSDGPPLVAGLVRTQDLNADGDTIDPGETLTVDHVVNSANEIESSVANGSATSTFVYDRNGNLVFDDNYWYQYDAWNRLVQVHDGSSLSSTDFGADGMLLDPNAAAPRAWITRYIYDAFGRLIRKRMPHPGDATVKVTENYFYDGVRRIQTRVKRPLVALPEVPLGEEGEYNAFAGQAADAYVEHVYGPGYVDEFVATVAEDGATQYILQDANYNVMALISGGPPPGGSAPPAGTVLEQYQYSPYGELIVRDQLASSPTFNPIGHQGLFYQRHDAGPHLPPLDVGAVGLYYNRARFYSPSLGRFVQKDMNETGLLVTPRATTDAVLNPTISPFSGFLHYQDGLNLYAYAQLSPITRLDASGLFSLINLLGSTTTGVDQNFNTLDTGLSLLDAIQGIAALLTDRQRAIADFATLSAAGEDDLAFEVWELNQAERQAAFSNGRGWLTVGAAASTTYAAGGDLRTTLHGGSKVNIVYVGTSSRGARYVGITSEAAYAARKRAQARNGIEITPFMRSLTRNEARAIETNIINSQRKLLKVTLLNKIRSISPRRWWYEGAMKWARRALNGRRIFK